MRTDGALKRMTRQDEAAAEKTIRAKERASIVRYIRREASLIQVAMFVPDQIIKDTLTAIAEEVSRGYHVTRVNKATKGAE